MKVVEFWELMLVDRRAVAGGFNNKHTAAVANRNFVSTAAIRFYNVLPIGNLDANKSGISCIIFSIVVEVAKDNSSGDLLIWLRGGFLCNFFSILKREGR